MTCSLEKSLFGAIVINCLELSITASKAISAPLELVVLRMIKLSTFAFVIAELSLFLMGSSKAMVISELTAIPVVESAGVKSKLGAVESAVVKVISVSYTHLTLPTKA